MPPGRWAVAVSGGADSVALLRLLHDRGDLALHVAHLDHEIRGDESTADADFVRTLAQQLNLPATIARRSDIEPDMLKHQLLPANPSARYRAGRIALFRQVVQQHNLNGVILAHHADDQAETILQRLLRGAGPQGLTGMRAQRRIKDLLILRPLLEIRRNDLRAYLQSIHQPWREDLSNISPKYMRNRLRRLLARHPDLTPALLNLAAACQHLNEWIETNAPTLPDAFNISDLDDWPTPLARQALRQWLIHHGAPPADITRSVLDRLEAMLTDAATPPRQHFPGQFLVHRRQGRISIDSPNRSPKQDP
jgi:tRNA(Ile)-lysidine synthase